MSTAAGGEPEDDALLSQVAQVLGSPTSEAGSQASEESDQDQHGTHPPAQHAPQVADGVVDLKPTAPPFSAPHAPSAVGGSALSAARARRRRRGPRTRRTLSNAPSGSSDEGSSAPKGRSPRVPGRGAAPSIASSTGDTLNAGTAGDDLVPYKDIISRLEGDAVCIRASAPVALRANLVCHGTASRCQLLSLLESGQWYREVRLVLKVARRYLRSVLPGPRTCIVFDVDDTALSSTVYMARTHFARHPMAAPDWYHCARVPALLPVLEFYHFVQDLGFQVVFLSERPAEAFHQTKEALVRAGYADFTHLITRPPASTGQTSGELKGTTMSSAKQKASLRAGEFKFESREALQAQGFDIAAVVGDQDSDFIGGLVGLPVKIPNYLYIEE